MTGPRVVPQPKLNEAQLTRCVADLAKERGWLRYHTHRSDYSPAGYPDETLLRGDRIVVAELKSDHGKLSPKQQEWIDAWRHIPGAEVHVWRPEQWWDDTIRRVLW